MEGHGAVEGLLHAVYTGDVNETVDGFLKFQLLKLGGAGSDEEGPNEVDDATMWGADPAFVWSVVSCRMDGGAGAKGSTLDAFTTLAALELARFARS